ncbi:hypothetical protein C1646_768872 [Rhizophagus diaphanus]|nr:hypothetical protein C1646_768872 [Rhizophagus diaphanus] [Rhizophagus sp. MUCL 43196]
MDDNIISTSCSYNGAYIQFKINVKFIQGDVSEEFAKLIDDKTKAVYLKSMENPNFNIKILKKFISLHMMREYQLSLIIPLVPASKR